jgi:hypothetical protein
MARVQLTRIEELDRQRPELKLELAVSKMLDAGERLETIAAFLREQTGEDVPPQTISSYKQRRWLAEKRRIRERIETSEALLQVIGKHGISNVTQAEIYRVVDEALRGHAKIDPHFALREQRLWAVHQANVEKIETEKRRLELEIERSRRAIEEATDEAKRKIGSGEQLTLEDINRIRERTFGSPVASGE